MPANIECQRPSILFVDAYDSFTNNIISLLTTTLNCSVRVVRIDTPLFPTDASLAEELRQYDAVVLGPGPGHPENESDVGLMRRIWVASAYANGEGGSDTDTQVDIPILGICLGFQSLGLQGGGAIRRLTGGGMHGVVRRVTHCGRGIYQGVGEVDTTLYQSLCVDLGQNDVSDDSWEVEKWTAKWKDTGFQGQGTIEPLAWVEQQVEGRDKRILVASKHSDRPWWGLQYHPESICTNEESKKVILNWMGEVNNHNAQTGRKIVRGGKAKAGMPVRPSLLAQTEAKKLEMNGSRAEYDFENEGLAYGYASKVVDLGGKVDVPDIIARMEAAGRDLIVLESTNNNIRGIGSEMVRGRYTTIALHVDNALRVEYSVGNAFASVLPASKTSTTRSNPQKVFMGGYGGIWPFLANYLDKRRINDGNVDVPFWGGFMGYTTYELGLEGIDVPPHSPIAADGIDRPDLNFAWITDSIVIDHQENKVHLQQLTQSSIHQDAEPLWWLDGRGHELVNFINGASSTLPNTPSIYTETAAPPKVGAKACTPDPSAYQASVRTCQSYISAGESYELCLTSLSTLSVPTVPTPSSTPLSSKSSPALSSPAWSLYRSLRAAQPSPFSSFIRLGPATFISCSPERFLSWTSSGRCELRPMKGTVKKSLAPTRAEAEALLDVEKERAENLMIVDLVRHDLYGVCGAGNVAVTRLMGVEEYESVWQMVTVVVGNIPGGDENPGGEANLDKTGVPREVSINGSEEGPRYSGIDVLAASLPPGSMTGAPKKRSCELLNEIEHGRRSLYSGVVGYMDVGGRGDFSVNIRCAFKWDDECQNDDGQDTWYVGAGGAVTALSEDRAEREEMETKLFNTLNGFGLGLNLGRPPKPT
ncbi:hypothetical protein V500_07054 [Pseudogymnoascus sp. VKM F-4518 (FW-2643)]|nr:hypothetical protein V500_07054 [Pseudogymnoascus sp. VKM F-4518 (FW-2643)]